MTIWIGSVLFLTGFGMDEVVWVDLMYRILRVSSELHLVQLCLFSPVNQAL